MPLVQLVITLIVVGVLLWAMNTYIPMDPKIRKRSAHSVLSSGEETSKKRGTVLSMEREIVSL
jgi:hypothetical protein